MLGCQLVMTKMIRLLLVDDEPAVRKGLHMRLAAEPDFEVVGEAGDGETAVALAQTLRPDVILMDIAMPAKNGITATEELHTIFPQIAVIVLSMYDDASTQERAKQAGAAAFIPKRVPTDRLMAMIRQAAHDSRQTNAHL